MDARLYFDSQMSAIDLIDLPMGRVAAFSRGAPDHDGANEDAAAVITVGDALVLCVADGMGGAPAGEQASGIAVQSLVAALEAAGKTDSLRDIVLTGFEDANRAVTDLGVGAATTLAVAVIEDDSVRTFHVGDSEILVTGLRGRRKVQTVSHSPVAYAVEAGFLDESEALVHEDRNLILNMIGSTDMRIEMGSPQPFARYDSLVIGSDGLFDNLQVDEVAEHVRSGPLKRSAGDLLEACTTRIESPREGEPSKSDDLTYLVFRRKK